jgi:glycosyltransferase involved in cell wall biosynthesis
MKIAILGTKGIPNNYGGYEQFAEFISKRLTEQGHSVTVYNPHFHRYKENEFNGVKIIRKYSPEKIIGGAANIIYDHLCLVDALRHDFDIIYEAGYHSVALSYKLLKVKSLKKPVIVTNMDGLEWRRSKWANVVQNIIKKLERIAVNHSPYLIADNEGIQEYLKNKYAVESFYLPYGADPVEKFDQAYLNEYGVEAEKYFILVARLEPENNVETVIEGHIKSSSKYPLLVVGNQSTRYGKYLQQKFQNPRIRFAGGIYNKPQLDSLRHFSLAYFHGHSVGGTNPSLLEAMASQSFIIAHKNPFNTSILGDSALYFNDMNQAKACIDNIQSLKATNNALFTGDNLSKIKTLYNWNVIVEKHEKLFKYLLSTSSI